MAHRRKEPGLIVFVGPTGDHNDRGMEGAPIVGRELSRRLDLTPTVIGRAQPATSEPWQTALPAALPGLRELQREHSRIVERGAIPIAALPRCAASLATLPTVAKHHPEALVVWFDAHADRTPLTTRPPDTSVVWSSARRSDGGTPGWDQGSSPDRVVLGGTRDLDAPEQALVDAGTIKLAAGASLYTVLDEYVGDRPVYLHLDCDVLLKPGTVPTDYHVPNGLTLEDLAVVSQRLSQNQIVGIEIAEFESAADPTDDTNFVGPLLDVLAPMITSLHTRRA